MLEKVPPDLSKFLLSPMPGLLVRLSAGEGDLHNLRGAALLAMDQPAAAEASFSRAHELGCAHARSNLGISAWQLGRHGEAREHWRSAIADNPDDADARANLARISSREPVGRGR